MKAAKARTNLKTDLAAEGARLRERAVASDARRGDYPASLQPDSTRLSWSQLFSGVHGHNRKMIR
jgi:hypothetical protein